MAIVWIILGEDDPKNAVKMKDNLNRGTVSLNKK